MLFFNFCIVLLNFVCILIMHVHLHWHEIFLNQLLQNISAGSEFEVV